MPRDAPSTPKPDRALPRTLADLLADDEPDLDMPDVGTLAPLTADTALPRSPHSLPVPDLSTFTRAMLLIGEGNLGKTLLARYLADQLIVRRTLDKHGMFAVAPGNRNLTAFVETVMQPETTDPRATAEWTRKALFGLARRRIHGTFDGGGGDASMGHLIRTVPGLTEALEEHELALIAAYFLGPRVDDLAFLASYEAAGFRPRATALILNRALAETPSAFDDIRRQPAYKAALDRGAVELWLPPMPQAVALAVERKRLHFTQARDGQVPEGRSVQPLGAIERVQVRAWLEEMARELAPIETWLPWA